MAVIIIIIIIITYIDQYILIVSFVYFIFYLSFILLAAHNYLDCRFQHDYCQLISTPTNKYDDVVVSLGILKEF